MTQPDGEDTTGFHWTHAPRNIVLVVLVQGAVFFALGLPVWYLSGRSPSEFLGWDPSGTLIAVIVGGALIASMQSVIWAFPLFIKWAARQQQPMLFPAGRRYHPVHIVLISVGAGVGEEALFRGGLQSWMSDHLPVGAAIILASLLFVVLHLGSRGVSAFIFAHSLTFGMAYHLTDSLVGVMLAHTSFDIWALAMLQRELAREGLLMD